MNPSSRGEPHRTLGMFLYHRITRGSDTNGSQVATDDTYDAILRYGSYEEYALTGPIAYQQRAELLLNRRGSGVTYSDLLSFLDRDPQLHAWHLTELNDTTAVGAMHLRARARHFYPITAIHHAFSTAGRLRSAFLPFLLGDFRACDAFVCSSRASQAAMVRVLEHLANTFNRSYGTSLAYRARTAVIPLGVDTNFFQPGDRSELRRRLEFPEDAFIMLWIGRLSLEYKADLLPTLKVLRALKQEFPERKLLFYIAGSPRHKYDLEIASFAHELGVAENIHIDTKLPREKMPHVYAAADVFVSPADNLQEAFGITPVEAMACGTPQVVSDWDGYRDTVDEGVTGFRVPTYWTPCDDDLRPLGPILDHEAEHLSLAQATATDLGALQQRLATLIRNEELRRQFGEASRKRAVERFSWQVVVRQYEALWEELHALAAHEERRTPPDSYMQMPYCDAFQGYPTRSLGDDTVLRLTDDGRAAIEGEAPIPLYRQELHTMRQELVGELFQELCTRPTVALGSLVGEVHARLPHHALSMVRRHAMWMLKYGFIELV